MCLRVMCVQPKTTDTHSKMSKMGRMRAFTYEKQIVCVVCAACWMLKIVYCVVVTCVSSQAFGVRWAVVCAPSGGGCACPVQSVLSFDVHVALCVSNVLVKGTCVFRQACFAAAHECKAQIDASDQRELLAMKRGGKGKRKSTSGAPLNRSMRAK